MREYLVNRVATEPEVVRFGRRRGRATATSLEGGRPSRIGRGQTRRGHAEARVGPVMTTCSRAAAATRSAPGLSARTVRYSTGMILTRAPMMRSTSTSSFGTLLGPSNDPCRPMSRCVPGRRSRRARFSPTSRATVLALLQVLYLTAAPSRRSTGLRWARHQPRCWKRSCGPTHLRRRRLYPLLVGAEDGWSADPLLSTLARSLLAGAQGCAGRGAALRSATGYKDDDLVFGGED